MTYLLYIRDDGVLGLSDFCNAGLLAPARNSMCCFPTYYQSSKVCSSLLEYYAADKIFDSAANCECENEKVLVQY